MKKYCFIVAFLFAVVCYAAPPGETVYDVSKTVQIDGLNDYQTITAEMVKDATEVNLPFAERVNVAQETDVKETVREVATIRKYSNLITVNSAATMNDNYAELTAIVTTTTDVEHVFKCPLYNANMKGRFTNQRTLDELPDLLFKYGVITDKNSLESNNDKMVYHRDLQHCNYAYPFGAHYNMFFS